MTFRFARLSSGASMTDREDDERQGKDDSRDELDEDEIGPDQQLLLALPPLAREPLPLEVPPALRLPSTCLVRLERPRQPAVAADAPEVHGHEDRREERQPITCRV